MTIYERLGMKAEVFQDPLFTFGGMKITLEMVIVLSILMIGGYLVSHAIQRAMNKAFAIRGVENEGTLGVTQRLVHYIVMIITILGALDLVGISLDSLFAAGAIFAIGIGFAMQNIVQNFVSGIILLTERTIKPGDILQVDGRFVRVRHMGFRSTICRTLDEEDIIIPNAGIVQTSVTNYTLKDSFYRLRATLGVSYNSDLKLVKETLLEVAVGFPMREKEFDPVVILSDFGDSAVIFEVSIWISDPWSMRRMKSDLNTAIWWALKQAGVVIAYPQLDLHLDSATIEAIKGRKSID